MFDTSKAFTSRRFVFGLAVIGFLVLLGTRSLNEPDEGRYSTIAATMVETGDWLIPKFWYLPHLDKPPMTYWLVAASIKFLGRTEFAIRLPLAVAGLSGLLATMALANVIAGRKVAIISGLILQSSILYFAMSRMLTTDIILCQFVIWAVFCFWKSWHAVGFPASQSWQLAAWTAVGLGFLTKGPLAPVIPLVAVAAIWIQSRSDRTHANQFVKGLPLGILLFAAIALPWFLYIFKNVENAYEFMVKGQVVGHTLGTAVRNRKGHPLYYVAILVVGFLPWITLVPALLRKSFWQIQDESRRKGLIMLGTISLFVFILFSLMRAKLPAYILPMFPTLAILTAYFIETQSDSARIRIRLRVCMMSAFVLFAAFPIIAWAAFGVKNTRWIGIQTSVIVLLAIYRWHKTSSWTSTRLILGVTVLSLTSILGTIAEVPWIETSLRSNQTLKPIAQSIKALAGKETKILAWGRLPQGLPLYTYPLISFSNRPFMGSMPTNIVPFEFPGNMALQGSNYLSDENALRVFLANTPSVLLVGYEGTYARFLDVFKPERPQLVTRSGKWELIQFESR